MLSKIVKLPITDREFIKSWFSDLNNIVNCIPSALKDGNSVLIEIPSIIINKKIKMKYYIRIDKNFCQLTLEGKEDKMKITVILDDEPFAQIYYEGNNEANFYKIFDEIGRKLKEKIYFDYVNYKENFRNANLSEHLKRISFVTKLVAKSKLILEKEINTNDLISSLEELIASCNNYPVLYISAYGDGIFRLIFVNGEFRGIYINYGGKESYVEEDLKNLKGKFKISVYATKLGDILPTEE
ncbi:hypothetical protein [Acidianus infernus]|uniref:hypothetical protein n=1 Tax=Acidianus infernus TaxID=12915 RepID=UPI0012DFA189|nr:hypothetical protein [Acidianus infernus]